ncbi:hypothetical protein K2173_001195 [Erythroxylum novogranatense]|uniref:SHSP domain-containing protein n=1 Tax=Erythroxylum novogranatense TaxID=1862640 RepID=A0AAV8T485_9ROSI|nr:hypothetical protein K2173_001195 [Erythroxylum novogranatense]
MLHSLLQDDTFDPDLLQAPSNGLHIGWKETPKAHIFEIELPGLTKEDIKGEIKWHRKERMKLPGGFSKEFRLPNDAKVDEIKASMRDGLLTVLVPKHHHHGQNEHDNNNKDSNTKHNEHYAVTITGPAGDSSEVDVNEDHHRPKGRLGHFVCCKA